MGQLYIPSFSEIMAVAQSRGADSDAPDLWNGLVGAWPMQEGGGSRAFDVSGYGRHGTLTNMDPATDWVVTEKGRALNFGGDATQENVIVNSTFGLSNANLSYSLWVYLASSSLGGCFLKVGSASGGGGGNGISIGVGQNNFDTNGNKPIGLFDGVRWIVFSGTIGTGLHHVALVLNDTTPEYFVDGVSRGKLPGTDARVPADNLCQIGGYELVPSPLRFIQALIANPDVYSRALLPSEIQQLYVDPYAMYRLRAKVFPAAVAPAAGALLTRLQSEGLFVGMPL